MVDSPRQDPDDSNPLTETELEVVRLIATGASNREVGHTRGVSEATVKKHVTNINNKLGTTNRVEMVVKAVEMGLVTVETPPDPSDEADAEMTRDLAEALADARRRADTLEDARRRHRRRSVVLSGVVIVLVASLVALGARGLADVDSTAVTPTRGTVEGEGEVPSSPLWVPMPRLPTARTGLALAGGAGHVFAIGGRDSSGVLDETLRYDGDAGDWIRLPDKPVGVSHALAVEVRGQLIVPGGCDRAGRATDIVEGFDIVGERWVDLPSLPAPRCDYALAELDGQIYLFGGRDGPDPGDAQDDVMRYEPSTGDWVRDDALPAPRSGLAAAAFNDTNAIHVIGGRDRDGDLEADHWTYQPFEAVRWEEAAPLPEGRAGLVMAALPTPVRRLYVVGGGWDRTVTHGTIGLTLGDERGWVPFASVPGPTPRRGAGLTIVERTLILAGGDVGDRMSDQAFRYEAFTPVRPAFGAP